MDIQDIIDILPKQLTGDWIAKNSSYEAGLCNEIGWVSTPRFLEQHHDDRGGRTACQEFVDS